MTPARVLVVRLSSLGDVILTTPVLASLKSAWPSSRISVLVKSRYADVFSGNPAVDEVLFFESRGFCGWLAEIRRRRFDVYLDLHDTPRSRLWGMFSGIPRRARYDKQSLERRRLVWTKKAPASLRGRVTDRYLACLPSLGVPLAARRPELFIDPEEAAAAAWRGRLGGGPLIGVAPGALHATKRWPAERFAAAADRLAQELSARVILLGAAGDRDAAHEVLSSLRTPALDASGRTSPRELFYLISRCAVLLTNDSGAMHAASALRVPTAAVFGPTVEPFGFFPEPACAEVAEVRGLYCRPCRLHGGPRCPEGHFRCMREISVDAVVAAARRAMARRGTAA